MRSRNWIAMLVLAVGTATAGMFALASSAAAYSAAQAEAQTDPSNDPYNFPNIELCCKPHHQRPASYCDRHPDSDRCICRRRSGHRRSHRDSDTGDDHDDWQGSDTSHHDHDACRRHGGDGYGGGDDSSGNDSVEVDCGADGDSDYVFTSLQEAVNYVEPGGVIRVRSAFPGNGCTGNVVITKDLTIQGITTTSRGDDHRYGSRSGDDAYRDAGDDRYGARRPVAAVVDGCVSIWGAGRPRVVLRDIEILGTTSGYWKDCNARPETHVGSSGLTAPRLRSGDNLFTALMVDGATLIGSNVSVRSAGRAFYAEHSVVQLTGGNLAAHPAYEAADAAVWLLRTQADLRGVAIAGGRDGMIVSMLDRYPVTFTDVSILPVRTQVGGVYPEDGRLYRGKTGVRVTVDYENLPSTDYHDLASFRWSGGTVHGYRQGIDLGPGVNAAITGVSIVDTKRGVHIARGAQAAFDSNKIAGSESVAIQIEPGATGQASTNDVSCAHGECICYGGDCDNDESDVRAPGFLLRGNVCRRERGRDRSYEDVGGSDW